MDNLQKSKYFIFAFFLLFITSSCKKLYRYNRFIGKDTARINWIYHENRADDNGDDGDDELLFKVKPTNNATKKYKNPNEYAPQSDLEGREW
ncbi:hypothetical protein ABVC71_06395 [Prevotella amnii]|jgi:hypothetical protein|uniref:hypothetical protein n=1 Tax=Prevotella amnii TaxID=419005 RepID=UPI00037E373E|nr:hypothetical protein [Prevotella amnii]